MKRVVLAAALAAGAVPVSAISQVPTPPLAYVQPVPPVAVQAVQSQLRKAGVYDGRVDGVWGPDSETALQRFQANHQLQATGQLNEATAAALNLDPATLLGMAQSAAAPPVPPPETLRSASVRAIQERLRRLGFYNGAVDGVWGQGTQAAIQQFQQNRGLQPNGQLNPATVSAIGLPPDALAYR